MIDKALLLSHPRYHEANLCQVIETLLDDNCPLKFIFDIVHKRLIYHSTKNKNGRSEREKNKDSISDWFTLPYVPGISDKIKTTIIY